MGYAGGFLGFSAAANVGGIIDNTLVGVANFLCVKAKDVTISGCADGLTVRNEEGIASGACARSVGGTFTNVDVTNLKEVTSPNYTAGFMGRAGLGGLADADGLNLFGVDLLKVGGLLLS